jgi:hypothetical protein
MRQAPDPVADAPTRISLPDSPPVTAGRPATNNGAPTPAEDPAADASGPSILSGPENERPQPRIGGVDVTSQSDREDSGGDHPQQRDQENGDAAGQPSDQDEIRDPALNGNANSASRRIQFRSSVTSCMVPNVKRLSWSISITG